MRIWLVLLVLALPAAGWSQDRQRVTLSPPAQESITIEAHVIEYAPPIWRAERDILFQQGQKRLSADELFYNAKDRIGLLTAATFTTCDLAHPDYRITAREIRLTPDQHLKARRVRIYLGRLRVLSLPSLSVNVGPSAGGQELIPRPGFSNEDGLFVSAEYSLVSTADAAVNLRLRLTSNRGVQGGVTTGYAVKGDLRLAPPYVPDFDSELRRQSILQPVALGEVCIFPEMEPQPSQFSAFGALLARERAYDINEPSLLVTRLPEIGVRYVAPESCPAGRNGRPTIGMRSEVRTSWGRFKETPGDGYIGRWDVRGTASTTLRTLGRSTSLRASGLARLSNYGNGDSFRVLGAALDVSRIYSRGSFASLRLIAHATSGATPFEFDNIDIRHELEAAGRYVRGRNTYGILLSYDLDKQSLRDWEFSFARRLHCLEPSVTWHNRFNQISFDLRVLGL